METEFLVIKKIVESPNWLFPKERPCLPLIVNSKKAQQFMSFDKYILIFSVVKNVKLLCEAFVLEK